VVLGPDGVKNNSLRCASLKQVFALIRLALRSSAHPQGDPEYRTAENQYL